VNRQVTVYELIERTESEGLAVRLRWGEQGEEHHELSTEEWPTGVMPKAGR